MGIEIVGGDFSLYAGMMELVDMQDLYGDMLELADTIGVCSGSPTGMRRSI